MGNKQPKATRFPINFDPTEWKSDNFAANQSSNIEYGQMITLKHFDRDQHIDKYQQTFQSKKDYEDYLNSFEWRQNEPHIVHAHYIQTIQTPKYCSTAYTISIYIEHPKNRLSDFSDIPFPDTMYCLKSMLIGFSKLFQYVGSFPLKQQQICIDHQGNVKVWLNKDLSKNYPEEWEIKPQPRSPEDQEQQMVSQIVRMIAKNSDLDLEPHQTFLQFYEKHRARNQITFKDAIDLVEQYTEMNNKTIPEYFTSVVEVYENQQRLYKQDDQQDNNRDDFGEYTERQLRNDQHFRESQVRDNRSNRSYRSGDRPINLNQVSRKSRQSRSSRQRYASGRQTPYVGQQQNSNILNQSMGSNQNKGQTYRLSSLSQLQDKKQQRIIPTYQPLHTYQPSHSNTNYNNVYRVSDAESANNFSQISQNGWVSLKPQQPYIPSSQANINILNGDIDVVRNNLGSTSDHLASQFNHVNTVRTQGIQSEDENAANYSISQKQEQNNMSANLDDKESNRKFERQLQQVQSDRQQPLIISRPSHQRTNKLVHNNQLEQHSIRTGKNSSQLELNEMSNPNNPSNYAHTGHFIQISNSSYIKSSQHQSSTGNLHTIEKNPSGNGFTIVVKSPSQQKIGLFQGNSSQPRMIKNNSQPYFSAVPAYPSYAPMQPYLAANANIHSIGSIPQPQILTPRSQTITYPGIPVQPILHIQKQSPVYVATRVGSNIDIPTWGTNVTKSNKNIEKSNKNPETSSNKALQQQVALVEDKSETSRNYDNESNENSRNDIEKINEYAYEKIQQSEQGSRVAKHSLIETVYCTVNDDVPLDPQIAQDMLLYV